MTLLTILVGDVLVRFKIIASFHTFETQIKMSFCHFEHTRASFWVILKSVFNTLKEISLETNIFFV